MGLVKRQGLADRIIVGAGLFALTAVVALSTLQVVLRYFFRAPLSWSEEMARFFEAWVIFIGSYYALKKGAHVSVDYFVKMAPKAVQRAIAIFSRVLILVVLLFILRSTVILIQEVWGTTSSATGYPAPLLPAALCFGALAMAVETAMQLIRLIRGQEAIGEVQA